MLIFEMLLTHGFPIIMMVLLLSDATQCFHLMASMRDVFPCLFSTSAKEDVEAVSSLVSQVPGNVDNLGRPDAVGIHRLASMSENYTASDHLHQSSIVTRRNIVASEPDELREVVQAMSHGGPELV